MGASSIPAAPLPFQLPACGPGKAVEDGPRLWDPAPAWETWKRLLASDWNSIGRCAHLGVNHRTERKIFCPKFTPQVSETADAMLIRSQEPLLGLPRRCRVPKALGRPPLLSWATGRKLEGKWGCQD